MQIGKLRKSKLSIQRWWAALVSTANGLQLHSSLTSKEDLEILKLEIHRFDASPCPIVVFCLSSSFALISNSKCESTFSHPDTSFHITPPPSSLSCACTQVCWQELLSEVLKRYSGNWKMVSAAERIPEIFPQTSHSLDHSGPFCNPFRECARDSFAIKS